MAEPFLSEIRLFSFNFPPQGWAFCNGQLLPVNQNLALFSLLGTTFGGDGRVNFALPDLRGRVPIHVGMGHTLGERAGEQTHTLSVAEMAAHQHLVMASGSLANTNIPIGNVLAVNSSEIYANDSSRDSVISPATTSTGGSLAHLNMQPFLSLNFCIALVGIFPSWN